MNNSFDVNPAYEAWKSSTGREKEWNLQNLTRLLERYARAICYERLPDHDTGSINNEIVWRAIKQADKFKGDSQFSTWFYKIAVNECNRYLRRFKNRVEVDLPENLPGRPEAIDARLDIIRILEMLEGEDHQLFRLLAEGESLRGVGQALGISHAAARKRWDKLRGKIHATVC